MTALQEMHQMTRGIESVDLLPAPIRACVHEFGWSVVQGFLQNGIKNPNTIRQLVHVVQLGAREDGNKRLFGNKSSRAANSLDKLLMSSGSTLSAAGVIEFLRLENCLLVYNEPSDEMIAASIMALKDEKKRVTVEQKHRLRLRAGIRAGAIGTKMLDDVL